MNEKQRAVQNVLDLAEMDLLSQKQDLKNGSGDKQSLKNNQSDLEQVKSLFNKVPRSQAANFCEAFQDLVDTKNIEFPNDDKPEDEPKTTIYGSDWDFLLDEVIGILENEFGLTVSEEL